MTNKFVLKHANWFRCCRYSVCLFCLLFRLLAFLSLYFDKFYQHFVQVVFIVLTQITGALYLRSEVCVICNVYCVAVSVSLFDQYTQTLAVQHSTRSRTSMTSPDDYENNTKGNKNNHNYRKSISVSLIWHTRSFISICKNILTFVYICPHNSDLFFVPFRSVV